MILYFINFVKFFNKFFYIFIKYFNYIYINNDIYFYISKNHNSDKKYPIKNSTNEKVINFFGNLQKY